MAGTPSYPPDWAQKFKALEDKVKAAFTAAQTRVRFARILAQLLTVGEGDGRIELVPGVPPTINFVTASGTAVIKANNSATGVGVHMDGYGSGLFSFNTQAAIDAFAYYCLVRAQSVDNDVVASVYTAINDVSKRASVVITATGTGAASPGDSLVQIVASGGLMLPDLAGNPASVGVLYTVGNSLRWKDPSGAVHTIV